MVDIDEMWSSSSSLTGRFGDLTRDAMTIGCALWLALLIVRPLSLSLLSQQRWFVFGCFVVRKYEPWVGTKKQMLKKIFGIQHHPGQKNSSSSRKQQQQAILKIFNITSSRGKNGEIL